ncbi:MAG: transketolase [Elioraea sp.]|nr:transketolase [Elioraea sp.]
MALTAADHRLAALGCAPEDADPHDERGLSAALRATLRRGQGPVAGTGQAFAAGLAEVATVLWTRVLKFDSADPAWPDRDRIVVAAADDGGLLAALHTLTGHAAGWDTAGQGETVAGASGQGLGVAVGLALAERLLAARFGRSLVDHRTWVLAASEELARGSSHEAAAVAGDLRLGKLTVLAESGAADRGGIDDVLKLFALLGWATKRVDAADPPQVLAALAYAVRSARPTLILCRAERPLAETESGGEAALAVSAELARAWAEAGRRGARERLAWRRRHQRSPHRDEFDRAFAGRLPETWRSALDAWKAQTASARCPLSTREASRQALEALAGAIPDLSGAVAGPAGPPASAAKPPGPASPAGGLGRHVGWGAREVGMAAATAGLALHGGLVPYAACALAAGDAIRPALRLAAVLRRRAIHLLHERADGGPPGAAALSLGELAALRAVPNLFVFRPADAVEVAEAWALAAAREDGPSALVLGETPVPPLRGNHTAENLSARGGYVLAEADGPRQATLIATGAEVAIALGARDILKAQGVAVAVVSLPCFELFAAQDETWRAVVLGGALRVGIESGIAQGWDRWLGLSGLFLGPETVPPAAREAGPPGQHLNPEGVAQAVLRRLS